MEDKINEKLIPIQNYINNSLYSYLKVKGHDIDPIKKKLGDVSLDFEFGAKNRVNPALSNFYGGATFIKLMSSRGYTLLNYQAITTPEGCGALSLANININGFNFENKEFLKDLFDMTLFLFSGGLSFFYKRQNNGYKYDMDITGFKPLVEYVNIHHVGLGSIHMQYLLMKSISNEDIMEMYKVALECLNTEPIPTDSVMAYRKKTNAPLALVANTSFSLKNEMMKKLLASKKSTKILV